MVRLLKVLIISSLRRGGATLINVTLGQGSQSDQAGGGLSFLFPDETLILAVFNYEELYFIRGRDGGIRRTLSFFYIFIS